jgi:hypothetical protein
MSALSCLGSEELKLKHFESLKYAVKADFTPYTTSITDGEYYEATVKDYCNFKVIIKEAITIIKDTLHDSG